MVSGYYQIYKTKDSISDKWGTPKYFMNTDEADSFCLVLGSISDEYTYSYKVMTEKEVNEHLEQGLDDE